MPLLKWKHVNISIDKEGIHFRGFFRKWSASWNEVTDIWYLDARHIGSRYSYVNTGIVKIKTKKGSVVIAMSYGYCASLLLLIKKNMDAILPGVYDNIMMRNQRRENLIWYMYWIIVLIAVIGLIFMNFIWKV